MTVQSDVSGGRLLLLFSVSLAESRLALGIPLPGEPAKVKKYTPGKPVHPPISSS